VLATLVARREDFRDGHPAGAFPPAADPLRALSWPMARPDNQDLAALDIVESS
jgi:hypothetical protein